MTETPSPERCEVPAALVHLAELREFARRQGVRAGFGVSRLTALDLVVEEAVVNVITHACPDCPGTVTVTCRADDAGFIVEIADTGAPFDPTAVPDPDTAVPLERRRAGGLGILLIRHACDALTWRRDAGRNILTCRLAEERPGSRGQE